jgi:hypothetical protein
LSAAHHHDSVNVVLDFDLRNINIERCFALARPGRSEHRTVYARRHTFTGIPVPVPHNDFKTCRRYGTGADAAVDGIVTVTGSV